MRKYLRGIPEKLSDTLPPEGIGYICFVRDLAGKESVPGQEITSDWERLIKVPVDGLLDMLPENQRVCARKRYGLDDGAVYLSYDEAGRAVGRSGERARQFIDRAQKSIRKTHGWYFDALYDNKEGINLQDASERIVEAYLLYMK